MNLLKRERFYFSSGRFYKEERILHTFNFLRVVDLISLTLY